MTFNVLTAEFLHETNTFNINKTGLSSFEADTLLVGDEGIAARGQANTGLAGCIDCSREFGWDMRYAVSAHAGPSGPVTTEAFEYIAGLILDAARDRKPDGVLLALHGAMVPEFCQDGEGELLARLRDVIGPDVPVAITLDLHANVSVTMCNLAQIIVSYKTYPHIDLREAACHGGNGDGDVAGTAQGLDLAGEDVLETDVVCRRRQRRRVRGQGQGGDGGAVGDVANGQLGGDVLTIRRTAAVAEKDQLAAGANGDGANADEPGKRLEHCTLCRRRGGLVGVEFGVEKFI